MGNYTSFFYKGTHMKKTFLTFAVLCGSYAPAYALSIDEIKSTICVYVDKFVLCILSCLQYLFPTTQNGIKSFFTSTYWVGRAMVARMFGQRPITMYDFLLERAKSNPLEAVGALTLVFLAFLSMYIAYRTLYRLLYWLLVTRRTK